jgi:Lrp/AsnC family transcriptional regulator
MFMLRKRKTGEEISTDATDRKILQHLQADATLTVQELARRINLSPTPCWRRVQRL